MLADILLLTNRSLVSDVVNINKIDFTFPQSFPVTTFRLGLHVGPDQLY